MLGRGILLSCGAFARLASASTTAHTAEPTILSSLLRRDEDPVASCPEQLGNAPMSCDAPACGGQGSEGVCKNNGANGKPCRCEVSTTSAPVPSATTITTTNPAGSTVVGVFDLVTIDKYKSLKQSQTVTISTTTTGKDGRQTTGAVVAGVAAGGVAWFLGTSADAAGAALLVEKPPVTPESNKDDPSCPATKGKCKDCGALSGISICVSPNGGCACEVEEDDKKCPSTRPKCNDEACGGKDGKCTVGDLKDCDCDASCPTEKPKCNDTTCAGKDGKCTAGDDKGCDCGNGPNCPDEEDTPFCNFCGDKGDDGKCKGLADKNDLWKGCACWDPPTNSKPPLQVPLNPAVLNFDWTTLPDVSPESYDYDGDDDLKCQDLSYNAKKDDLHPRVSDWCKSVDGKKVTKSGDTDVLYKRFDYDYYSLWLGAQYDGASGGNCGDSADVHEIDCVSTMLEEIGDCQPDDAVFKGAELTDGCVKYHVTFSTSKNDNDPPFKALDKKKPDCATGDDDTTPIANNMWAGVGKKFCQQVGDGKKAQTADLKNSDLQSRSLWNRWKRTPPPSNSAYVDWKFHYEWKPADGLCAYDCTQALASISNQCGHMGGQSNSMVKQGSLDTGCGTLTYALNGPPPKDTSPSPDGENRKCVPGMSSPRGFDRNEAMNTIIPQFCGQEGVKDATFFKDTAPAKLDFHSAVYPDMMISLQISRNDKCDEKTSTFVPQDRCNHLMGGTLVDSCSTDTTTDKMGGTLDDQCLSYSITSSDFKDDFNHEYCNIDLTHYYDGTNYKIDGVVKDASKNVLSQCTGADAPINKQVACQIGNHGRLPRMVLVTQRDSGILSFQYAAPDDGKQTWLSTDNGRDRPKCTGGTDKFKDGKRTIQCEFKC